MGQLPPDPCCSEVGTCQTNPYDYTKHLIDVDAGTLTLGFLLLAGTVISVVPQMIKIIQKKSVHGVSFHMLILAAYNQWSTVINYIMAQFSKLMACSISGKQCWANMISLYQALALFFCYFILLHEYMYFELKELGRKNKDVKSHLTQYILFMGFFIATIPSAIIPGVNVGACNSVYKVFAIFFVVIASTLSCLEWIPQIYKTYQIKGCGSFSIISMLIQCPGCAISLIVTISSGNQWYTWLSWIVSFILEFILCYFLVYYHCKQKKQAKQSESELSLEEQLMTE
ncbi:PQ_loop repeat-containing protein [Hexamita inflata]|uniref:PQ loop repeat-containing protein n=1 Tax=Hexamita inflata TaxID=28002 RepID=A0AA86RBY5_9EUKA|nr:PQ loop repeat-containing protein [Hexamita inflata]CAI9971828.1 PQ loop repeat-containing protein [Hexamita inflata]